MNFTLDFSPLLCHVCNQHPCSSTSEALAHKYPMAQHHSPKPPKSPKLPKRRKSTKIQDETVSVVRALFPDLRLNNFSQGQKRAFLIHFSTCGQVSKSARETGISHFMPYYWMKTDPAFAQAVTQAKAFAAQALESELVRRAMDGVEKGIYYKGEKIATEREYSDVLGIFLLKGAMPEKYRETRLTTHDVSPGMAALQQQWLSLRDADVPPRQLPAAEEIIDIAAEPTGPDAMTQTPRAGERPPVGSATKEQTFAMLDALNNVEEDGEGEDDED